MDDFDVLSFISLLKPPPPPTRNGVEFLKTSSFKVEQAREETQVVLENEDYDAPIHIFDLPSLTTSPPGKVLYILLKLMKGDSTTNFGGVEEEQTIDEKLKERDISMSDIDEIMPWLSENSILTSVRKLAYLSNNATDMNQYFITIVSSSLSWISDEELKEKIWKESSLRLSEKCGRTAKPNFTRKIVLSGVPDIKLYEPSMTSDNLGLKTWGSSLMLSQRLINNQRLLVEPILELGAGTGLIGITCLLIDCKDITLTDLPEIVPNLAKNVELNNVSDNIQTNVLDWSDSTSFEIVNKGKLYNTIILSDPIYSSQHPGWVVNMLTKFLSPCGKVLLQIPIRAHFASEREMLWKLMLKRFDEVETHYEDGYDDFGEQKFIFKVFKYSSSSNI